MKKKQRKDFTVDVYGQEWDIKFKTPVIEEGVRAYGLCDPFDKTIYIDSTLDDEYTSLTLLHELFHAYFRRMGMINSGVSHEVEEIIAEQFSQLLTENFKFDIS